MSISMVPNFINTLICKKSFNIGRNFSKSLTCLDEIKPKFLDILINRNPRNLEFMGIAWKRKGWSFHHPSKEYYHRLVFTHTHRHTGAHVEHMNGQIVTSCSTTEPAISKHLYSTTDQSAAYNIGRVLALRCLQLGLHNLLLADDNDQKNQKYELLKKAMSEGGVELSDVEERDWSVHYEPGIDYANEDELEELKLRQAKVFSLGRRSTLTKWLRKKRALRTRYRPIRPPRELLPPQAIYLQ